MCEIIPVDANDLCIWREVDESRQGLMQQFDLRDGPEAHPRKDQVRLLHKILGKPHKIVTTQVIRLLGGQFQVAESLKSMVAEPSTQRHCETYELISRFAEKFPPTKMAEDRWKRFENSLRQHEAAVRRKIHSVVIAGIDAEIKWDEAILDATLTFFTNGENHRDWPSVPCSWTQWRVFVETDPKLVKGFQNQARRWYPKASDEDPKLVDLVDAVKEEVYLTGVCSAGNRLELSHVTDLRYGSVGAPVWEHTARCAQRINETRAQNPNRNAIQHRTSRVSIGEGKLDSLSNSEGLQELLARISLELSPIEKAIFDLALLRKIPPYEISHHLQIIALSGDISPELKLSCIVDAGIADAMEMLHQAPKSSMLSTKQINKIVKAIKKKIRSLLNPDE